MLLSRITSLEFDKRDDDDKDRLVLPVGLVQRTRKTTKRSGNSL
jgi:hypothetical protein